MMPWTWFNKLWTDFPGGPIWSPGWGTKILKATWHGQEEKKKKDVDIIETIHSFKIK